MGATTQLARSLQTDAARAKSIRLWITTAGCVLALLALLWWARSSRDVIVRSVAPYRVTHINKAQTTMSLVHGNHSYVVRCDEHCGEFTPGGFYRMDDAGAVLQYKRAGQTISLPVIEEQTTFDVTGGRG